MVNPLNKVYLSADHVCIILSVGTPKKQRHVHITEAEALKLAYKLMSLGSGGSTEGRQISLEDM